VDHHHVNQIWQMLDAVIHPRLGGRERFFSRLNILLIVVIFGVPLAFSTPFLSDWAGCQLAATIKPVMSREIAMQMCDWFAILFQIAIFAAIGGIAFTQKFASDLEKTVTHWRNDLIATQYQSDQEGTARRQEKVEELLRLLHAPGNYAAKVREILRVMRLAIGETNVASYRYMWFAAKGMAFNFPGGLYGLLGFLFLVGQIYALSGKIVLDHLPAACQWQ
jgi:hypothetical protein